uniref:C2H2-type domain-containing protein n=2 Tax=Tetranychus urticae TaxID=32264 RepID=T1KZQ5_TETUR
MFYLLVEAKGSLNSASAINLFPWNFDVFHIGIYPHEPHQVFSSIHGNLPVPEKTVRDDFQRKVSIVVIKNKKRFICTNNLCNHGNEKFPKKENIILHLYKKYVLFVCVACGAMFHEKSTLGVHQASHCRFRKKLKAPDNLNDIKNEDDKVIEDDNNGDGEKNVDIKTEEEVFKILIQTALKRAHEDGLLIQFEKTEALINALSSDFKSMSFLVLLASIIMCQEGKYGLERDELQCHDDYYKIWMDTERCFQIVELATKKAISIEVLESRVKRGVGKESDSYVCKYPFCRCSGKFKRNTKLEMISHIEQSNYRLVCCGCHSSFKVISSLIRHSNDSCKHSKLLDKMKEAAKKY